MRKWLLVGVLAVAGIGMSANRADAWFHYGLCVQPYYASAAFPMQTPAGYFTNSYYFPWYYPWYANYNYSNGYYANWWYGGGYASYYNQVLVPVGPNIQINIFEMNRRAPVLPPPAKVPATKALGKVTIVLPADAKLLFDGVAAGGVGGTRTFATPVLDANRDYEYDLTAEVIRDGQVLTVTERAIVRAGETTTVTLNPTAVVAK